MAIAEDGTTPALTFSKSATSVTSPSFSPPSDSLLVAIASYSDYNQSGDGNNATLTISDSGGHEWAAGPNSVHSFGGGADHLGSFMAYTYLSSAPGTITVKFQQNKVACDMQLDVRVVTGAASSQTGAASVSGNHQGSNPESTLTTTEVGSWVYTAAVQFEYATTFTALANTTTIHSSIDSTSPSAGNGPNTLLTGRVTNATTTPGSLTIGWTNSPSAATYQTWLALEILPAGSPTTVNLTTAQVNVSAIAPVVNIGALVVNLLTAQINVAALAPTVTHSQITSGGPGTAGNIKLIYISAQTQALSLLDITYSRV